MRTYSEKQWVYVTYMDRLGQKQKIACQTKEVALHVVSNLKSRMPQLYFSIV